MSNKGPYVSGCIPPNPVHNAGAVVVWGGNATLGGYKNYLTVVPDTEVTDSIKRVKGIVIPAPSNSTGTFKTLTTGTFAYQKKGEFIIRRTSTLINGTANNLPLFSAAHKDARRSINKLENRRSKLEITAGWNYSTGAFLTVPTVQLDAFGNDHAARPSLAIPGEFILNEGTVSDPVQKDYPSKTQA